jgi:hypothetical protein
VVNRKLHRILVCALGGLLLLALAPMPYGYYMLLRVLVCIWCLLALQQYFAFNFSRLPLMGWGYVVFLVLYNPLLPMHLGRPLWSLVNLASLLFFVLATWKQTQKT